MTTIPKLAERREAARLYEAWMKAKEVEAKAAAAARKAYEDYPHQLEIDDGKIVRCAASGEAIFEEEPVLSGNDGYGPIKPFYLYPALGLPEPQFDEEGIEEAA